MKKILVPTDFSACADNAVEFAVQSAQIVPAKITILHAFELMGNLYTDYMGVNKEFNQSQFRDVHDKLAKLKHEIDRKEGIAVDTVVFTGAVKEGILQVTSEKDIDIIVMGTSGASGIQERLFGSKTSSVISKSAVPVLAIPAKYKWKKIHKILFVTNHYEKDPAILGVLFDLADLYAAALHVIVFTYDDDDAATFLEHSRRTPEYEEMLKKAGKPGMLTVSNIFGKEFEKSIDDYIRQNDIDILAMVTYRRNLPDKIFHPSMTKRMACHTTIPLLAIPTGDGL